MEIKDLKELIPLLAAIFGFIPVIMKWLSDRSKAATSHKLMEQAKEQIEFWKVWLEAQREIVNEERFTQLKAEVSQHLDDLVVTNINIQTPEKEDDGEKHSFFQKLFLLYMPKSASGWIFHTLFYIIVSMTILILWATTMPDPNVTPKVSSWVLFKNEMSANWDMYIFIILIAVVFQRLARRSGIRATKKTVVKES